MPTVPPVIDAALGAAGLSTDVADVASLSGGCIHRVRKVSLRSGRVVVIKTGDAGARPLFEAEAAGLRALAEAGAVLVPEPLAVIEHDGTAALVESWLEPPPVPPGDADWARFGGELAALHAARAGDRFGFETANFIGATPQPNDWMDDWVEFNRRHRLGYQLRLARAAGRVDQHQAGAIERIVDALDSWLPRRPRPALLHGDLWSGNALPSQDAQGRIRIAMIDPACSVGDGWADLAMMKLFGGFPQAVYEAYAVARGAGPNSPRSPAANPQRLTDAGDDDPARFPIEPRLAVYQLYHVLNHVNLFGSGYLGQALALVQRLLALR
jgi:fructosamine-3-kinase